MSFNPVLQIDDIEIMDEITTDEIIQLIEISGSFDWLNNFEEDIYTLSDGDKVRWLI